MDKLLKESRFDIISNADKAFILAFDDEMEALGYSAGGQIGDGFCWGPYMIIYAKTGVKAKKVAARVYIREGGIVLRLFFSKIDDHRAFVEAAPDHIKAAFLEGHGDCGHCHNDKDGFCKFRKAYTVDGRLIEKCNGMVFEYPAPARERLADYMGVLREFYAPRGKKAAG